MCICERLLSVVWLRCLLRAKLSYHCKAPGNHSLPSYMSDTVAAEMQSDWDLDQLNKGNQETIKGSALSSLLIKNPASYPSLAYCPCSLTIC